MLRFSRHFLLFAPLLAVAAVALVPADAHACGGCFHPPPPPDQPAQSTTVVTDHRMVLSLGTSTTTLWDQIEYAGDPSDFAWVLPTRGTVKVGVGTNAFIDALDQRTAPVVHAPRIVCLPPPGGGFGSGGGCNVGCGASSSDMAGTASDFGAGKDAGLGEDSGVVITGKSTAGPYDVVQIHGTDEGAIVGWLRKHSYIIPKDIEPILTRYVDEGFDFVAVRLSPGKGVQAMKPIRVTFDGRYPTLPLRMVAAGVGASVGVKLFVIGDGRWRAKNFETFLIDPSKLTWDFATARSDYTATRAAMAAKFPNGAFGLESSIDMSGALLPTTDPIGADAGPSDTGFPPAYDTGTADTAKADTSASDADASADSESDAVAEVGTDSSADTSTTPDTGADAGFDSGEDHTSDVDIAFGTHPLRRVTRLRGDLPVVALSIDQLEADETQAVLPIDVDLVKYKNENAVCPSGAQLSNVPTGTPSVMLGLSSAQCSTSGGEGDPLRLPLYGMLGFVALSLGRRAIRKRR